MSRREAGRDRGFTNLRRYSSMAGTKGAGSMAAVKKVLPGVGPRNPQVIVLVGATGDLSRRKLIPGLFHLASAGFIPKLRIVGVSLDDIDVQAFRQIAAEALDHFSARKVTEADWA